MEIPEAIGPRELEEVIVGPDTRTIHHETFIVSGTKFRYEVEGPIPNMVDGGLSQHRESFAYDGEILRTFDFNHDNQINLLDYEAFQIAVTGS